MSALRGTPAYRAEVARVVAEAPPLTPAQFDRLSVLLNPVSATRVGNVALLADTERKAA
jgi:hypothetical protein